MRDTSVESLIKILKDILRQRKQGQNAQARKLFDQIRADEFPVMPNIPMSHGLSCDPRGALFYIDHDWDDHGGDDPNWCNLFIMDVINALERVAFSNTIIKEHAERGRMDCC
jgi:hypothetical protein